MNGKKTLTPQSQARLTSALRLTGDLKKFFESLSALDRPDFRDPHFKLTKTQIQNKVEQLRRRLRQKAASKSSIIRELFSKDLFRVYASLGTSTEGASLEQIVRKSGLRRPLVQSVLRAMLKAGWVRMEGDRFFAQETSLDFQEIGSNLSFQKAFAESCSELSEKSARLAQDPEALVFLTSFSCDPQRNCELKNRLRSAVLDVLDEFQDDEGSILRTVTLAMV